jgi:hypothetical protein
MHACPRCTVVEVPSVPRKRHVHAAGYVPRECRALRERRTPSTPLSSVLRAPTARALTFIASVIAPVLGGRVVVSAAGPPRKSVAMRWERLALRFRRAIAHPRSLTLGRARKCCSWCQCCECCEWCCCATTARRSSPLATLVRHATVVAEGTTQRRIRCASREHTAARGTYFSRRQPNALYRRSMLWCYRRSWHT